MVLDDRRMNVREVAEAMNVFVTYGIKVTLDQKRLEMNISNALLA